MVIYKYVVPIMSKPFFDLELPAGAEILAFQIQNEQPMLWVLINKAAMTVQRHFAIRGTGEAMNDWRSSDTYIGTVQMPPFVWHLFETKG